MASISIQLHSVVPANLAERDLSDSEIWHTKLLLEAGNYYHISAPSGNGKTTLARVIYGIPQAFGGTLQWGGESVRDFSIKKWCTLRQRQLSIVFQDLRLFDKLTALENIQIKNELTNHHTIDSIEEMASQLNMKSLLGRKVVRLSQGERQRVAILRALCQPFDWLILDEPFSHLDHEMALKAAKLIRTEVERQEAGIIVLQLAPDQFFEYDQKLKL